MSEQWLAVDAGNSRLKFGLFVPSRTSYFRRHGQTVHKIVDTEGHWPHLRFFHAVNVDDPIPWQSIRDWAPDVAVVTGSNPQAVDRILEDWPTTLPQPIAIRDRHSIPIQVDVDSPEKVGLDRLLNGVAANMLRPANRPTIVVDSGTATTVNYISSDGVFCGGAILPGLEMSAKALDYYTAALPFVPVQELAGGAPTAVGRNTRDAIRSGLFWGQVGAIKELVVQMSRQHQLAAPDFVGTGNAENSPWMILTGGGGPVLSSQFPGMLFIPSLGMHGLVLTAWHRKG